MKPIHLLLLAACTALGACASPERSRDLANPRIAAVTLAEQVCSNCHGLRGVSVSPNFPVLAAQSAPYLVAQITAFRAHERSDPPGYEYMWGISRSLSDGQIQALADYYANQPPAHPPAHGDPARRAAGKAIFSDGLADQGVPACASCHGAEAAGIAAFPRLAGQHRDYLVKQLLVFQRTDERPDGNVMKVVAHSLSRQQIADVATFLQGMAAP